LAIQLKQFNNTSYRLKNYLVDMCDKNSLEACTQKVVLIITIIVKLLETVVFMFYPIYNIITMLDFFRNQHSKTECIVRSFGPTATCKLKTSSAQGVHHAGVAVELGLLLKNKKLVLMFLPRLLFNFATYYTLAECNRILLVVQIHKLDKNLHHAGVAAKVNLSMVKCAGMVIFSFSRLLYLAECKWMPRLIATMSLMMTSSAKALHHAGVAAMMYSKLMMKQVMEVTQMHKKLYKKMKKPNLFFLWECYSYAGMSALFGFCSLGSFPLQHVEGCRIFPNSCSTSLAAFDRQSSSII